MSRFYHYTSAPSTVGAPSPYKVMIATPVATAVCCDYDRSMVATTETLVRAGIRFEHLKLHGHCHVDDARNLLMREFLQSDCTDLFFIDADMGWQGKYVARLLRHPGDIVAGVYCHKSDDGTFPFHPGGDVDPNEHGLYEMPKLATGFMRIRRHVVEALYQRERDNNRLSRPGDELGSDIRSQSGGDFLPVARIIERGFPSALGLQDLIGNDLYTSGDYVLCLKARQLGFKCFMDPDMEFTHSGEKVWRGHFGNTVRKREGLWQQQFVEAVMDLKAGKDGPGTVERLFRHYGIMTDWHLTAEPLMELYRQAKQTTGDVLEFGSGLSTLVLGLALAGTNRTVHALEHDADYFQRTKHMLKTFEVSNVVLHFAPLVPQDDGTSVYGVEELPADIGLALLDGPPRRFGRLGVLKPLAPLLANAVLVIDDVGQHGDVVDWLRANGHDVNIRPGTRWWGVGTPKAKAMQEAAE